MSLMLARRVAQVSPINIWPQFFAPNRTASCSLYIWAALRWDAANTVFPLRNERRVYAH